MNKRTAGLVVGGGLALLLIVLTVWQMAAPVLLRLPVAPSYAPVQPGLASPEIHPFAPLPREAYAEIKERPLFVPSRRPPPPPETAPPPPPPQTHNLDRYSILGIIAAPDRATAMIRGPGGDTVHLHVGQVLDGWTLDAIAPNKLVFSLAGQQQELQFKTNKASQGQNAFRTNVGTPPR